ncbi:hypothetical protein KFE98_16380 [bacterium SCSIO 12741]|nr:hypothetical protein KFE98_16380 [bacterium SCSIO 12741]
MKSFLKWTGLSVLFLGGIVLFTNLLEEDVPTAWWEQLSIMAIGSVLLGGFFFLIDTKLIPWRRRQLGKKIMELFSATSLNDSCFRCELNGFELFVQLNFNLRISQYGGYQEIITFYVPRGAFEKSNRPSSLNFQDAEFMGKRVWQIHQTTNMGLKRAKKKLIKELVVPSKTGNYKK